MTAGNAKRNAPQAARISTTVTAGNAKGGKSKYKARDILPHKTYGEIQLTCARKKSYVCFKDKITQKWKLLVSIYDGGANGTANHEEAGAILFNRISKENLDKEAAKLVRREIIATSL